MTLATLPALPFRRILMTGGTGFVGRYLAPRVVAAAPSADLRILMHSRSNAPPLGWTPIVGEVVDQVRMAAIVAEFRPDLVIHMAAQASVGQSHDASEATWAVNFDGSFSLAKAVAAYAPEAAILFTSSAEVYGLSLCSGPVAETAPLIPQNCYARSKAATEFMLTDVLPKTSRMIVARPFNHLGAGQDERFVMASLAAQIARIEAGLQEPVVRVGNTDAARDFLDVEDVCDAYVHLLELAPRLDQHAVFNISTGQARMVRELLDILVRASTATFRIEVDPLRLRPNDIPVAVGLNAKICSSTIWRPKRELLDTVRKLLDGARVKIDEQKRQQSYFSTN